MYYVSWLFFVDSESLRKYPPDYNFLVGALWRYPLCLIWGKYVTIKISACIPYIFCTFAIIYIQNCLVIGWLWIYLLDYNFWCDQDFSISNFLKCLERYVAIGNFLKFLCGVFDIGNFPKFCVGCFLLSIFLTVRYFSLTIFLCVFYVLQSFCDPWLFPAVYCIIPTYLRCGGPNGRLYTNSSTNYTQYHDWSPFLMVSRSLLNHLPCRCIILISGWRGSKPEKGVQGHYDLSLMLLSCYLNTLPVLEFIPPPFLCLLRLCCRCRRLLPLKFYRFLFPPPLQYPWP